MIGYPAASASRASASRQNERSISATMRALRGFHIAAPGCVEDDLVDVVALADLRSRAAHDQVETGGR